MNLHDPLPFLASKASLLAFILLGHYLLSLGARFHWILDLFSHFTIQYAVGGLVLGIFLAFCQHYGLAALCMVIFALNAIETRHLMQDPWQFGKPEKTANLTIVQYNKLYRNPNYAAMRKWFEDNKEKIDIVTVMESGKDTIEDLKQFKDIFPYQFPENSAQRFNDVSILSRHPFTVTPLPVEAPVYSSHISRIELQKDGLSSPITIFSYHTCTPMTPSFQAQRNTELKTLAAAVKNDPSRYIIANGDWNITPYSPYFGDFLKDSGLFYQNFGIVPETTWISLNLFSFLKIPIDHILYNKNLEIVDIKQAPAMGSDHHALAATFHVP